MAIMPIPAAQAAAEPDMAAMTMQATMAALASPPERWPMQTRPKPKRLLLTPPTVMRFPMRRKKGIDMSVIPETCACRVAARPEIGGDRNAAHRDGRRDADQHQDEHGGEDHKHDHDGNPL